MLPLTSGFSGLCLRFIRVCGAGKRGIPQSRTFATKLHLAQQMLERAVAATVPAQWVVGDCVYSSKDLRHQLETQGQASVCRDLHPCLMRAGRANRWRRARRAAPGTPGVRWSAGEGSQGPRRYDWDRIRLPYATAPAMAHWLLIRRSLGLPEEYAYYRVYRPEAASLPELIAVAGQCWQIEVAQATSN